MTAKKTTKKIQARDVDVGNRTLEGVLLDLADQVKANDARCAEALEQATAALREIAETNKRLDQHAVEMRQMMTAILTINQEHKGLAKRTGEIAERVDALEKAS